MSVALTSLALTSIALMSVVQNSSSLTIEDDSNKFVGANVTVSGWGRTSAKSETSKILKSAFVTAIADDECKRLSLLFDVGPTSMCASGRSTRSAACFGDSGGEPFSY